MMIIRPYQTSDRLTLGKILCEAFDAGDSYAVPDDLNTETAAEYWTQPGKTSFLAEDQSVTLGTYYLTANAEGPGAHICSCGYVTTKAARGRGIASAMLAHSLGEARRRGFRGMQFNAVVSTNETAVRLWQRAGFSTVGRVPGAFHHPQLGYVDTLIMYMPLVDDPHA